MNIVKDLKILEEEFKFEPRNIEGRKEEKTKKLEPLLQQTHIKGCLDLHNTNITSLGNLEYIKGHLFNCKNLTSLGNLEYVGGILDLKGANLTSLGNLEHVEGCLILTNTNLTSLGNLKYVGDVLGISNTKITSLGNLKYVGNDLYLSGTNITYIDPSIKIKGMIYKAEKKFRTIKRFNEYYQDKQNLKEEFKFEPRRIEDRKEKQKDKKLKILTSYIHKFCNSEPELVEKFKKLFGVDKYMFREVMPDRSISGKILLYIFQMANSEDYFRILINDDRMISLSILDFDCKVKESFQTDLIFLNNFQDLVKRINNLKDSYNKDNYNE